MTYEINETHDPNLKSWVESANDPNTDYPIQNLPLCSFSRDPGGRATVGIVIGNEIVDLNSCFFDGIFGKEFQNLVHFEVITLERLTKLFRPNIETI